MVENKAIAFQGYKNRIDRDLANNVYWWSTKQPVRIESLRKEMKLYIMGTNIDGDTGIKVDKPKVGIEGLLTEVWLMRNDDKLKKVFP